MSCYFSQLTLWSLAFIFKRVLASRACRARYPNYRAPFVFDPRIVSRAKENCAFLVGCHSIEMDTKTTFLYQRSS